MEEGKGEDSNLACTNAEKQHAQKKTAVAAMMMMMMMMIRRPQTMSMLSWSQRHRQRPVQSAP
jgi:hypothetical protein